MGVLCYLAFKVSPFLFWSLLAIFFVRPLHLGWKRSSLLLVIFAVFLAKSFWYWLFGGNMYYPDISAFASNFWGTTYSYCLILSALSLVPPYRWWRQRAVVLAVLAAIIAAYGTWESLRVPSVRRYDVSVKGLPPSFDGFTLVQLSDIHCDPSTQKSFVEALVKRVNALKADLVCITGDVVDGSPEVRLDDLRPLADLRAKHGVLGCSGNHEFYSNYTLWRRHYADFGIRMLENESIVLTNGLDRLAIGGVMDETGAKYYQDGVRDVVPGDSCGGVRKTWPGPDVARAFAHVPLEVCRILLMHRPIGVATNAAHGVKLQLSGHTHGAPLVGTGPLIAALNEGHVRGFYQEGDLKLFVTPGSGQWVGFPLRIGVPSEISLLTLRRE